MNYDAEKIVSNKISFFTKFLLWLRMSQDFYGRIGDIIIWLFQIKWIVSQEDYSLGIRICGISFWYYKYSDPMASKQNYQIASKREFGEIIKSRISGPMYSRISSEEIELLLRCRKIERLIRNSQNIYNQKIADELNEVLLEAENCRQIHFSPINGYQLNDEKRETEDAFAEIRKSRYNYMQKHFGNSV